LISRGSLAQVRDMLGQLAFDEQWQSWMRSLSLDFSDIRALAFIQEEDFSQALGVLEASPHNTGGTRRAYLTGYALFQNGDAEQAVNFFEQARFNLYGVTFPHHSDPVLYVQSIFFLAETALARGESDKAQLYYRDFLTFWGGSDWDLQAVKRARSKLETLSMKTIDR
jgi:tetratricopeptide (TPR) repeat protein